MIGFLYILFLCLGSVLVICFQTEMVIALGNVYPKFARVKDSFHIAKVAILSDSLYRKDQTSLPNLLSYSITVCFKVNEDPIYSADAKDYVSNGRNVYPYHLQRVAGETDTYRSFQIHYIHTYLKFIL